MTVWDGLLTGSIVALVVRSFVQEFRLDFFRGYFIQKQINRGIDPNDSIREACSDSRLAQWILRVR